MTGNHLTHPPDGFFASLSVNPVVSPHLLGQRLEQPDVALALDLGKPRVKDGDLVSRIGKTLPRHPGRRPESACDLLLGSTASEIL